MHVEVRGKIYDVERVEYISKENTKERRFKYTTDVNGHPIEISAKLNLDAQKYYLENHHLNGEKELEAIVLKQIEDEIVVILDMNDDEGFYHKEKFNILDSNV